MEKFLIQPNPTLRPDQITPYPIFSEN